MDGVVGIGATVIMLLIVGGAIGMADRARFRPGWLLVAAALVVANDALLTRCYGLLPRLAPGLHLNWQGKAMALAVTLVIAAWPAFGWARAGLTWRQAPGSLRAAAPAVLFYGALIVSLALLFPNEPPTGEDWAFQATMPGLEEEAFYRGVLLFALDRAFAGRVRVLGADLGWSAVLSSALFGLTHAFGFAHGGFAFDPLTMALTAGPALLVVWIRVRTGSLVLPVVLHNAGNLTFLLL